jgi:UDP-glucose:glycoprotein glucosyltransferase
LNSLQYAVGLALQYFQENVGFRSFSESHLFTPWRFIQVYSGLITDTDADNIENYFYDLPTAMKKRNRHVVPDGDGDGLRITSLPDLHQQAGLNASSAMFIYPSKTILSSSESLTNGNVVSERVPLSIYVIADLDTEEGLSTLRAALLYSVS